MYKKIKKTYENFISNYSKGQRYRVIDLNKDILTLFCNWTKQSFRLNINKITEYEYVISNMLPEQACFVGLIIGEKIIQHGINCKKLFIKNGMEYYSSSKLSMIIDRYGMVKILNILELSREFVNPLSIVRDREKINLLPSDEALRLGIHVSLSKNKLQKYCTKKNIQHIRLITESGKFLMHS